MSTEKISIKQLPVISEINNGDLLLVATPSSTNTLDYKDFVIGLENTTFASTISSHSTDIENISSIVEDQFFDNENIVNDGIQLIFRHNGTDSPLNTMLLPITIRHQGSLEEFFMVMFKKNTIVDFVEEISS